MGEPWRHVHCTSTSYIEGLASFKEEIVKSALDCRRSHWSQLRSKTAPTIFAFLNPPPGIFNTNQSKERGEYPPFQAFSAFPGDNSIFRPFLFPNQTKDFKVIFQCDWLVEIMRSLIFGANSIGGGSKAPNSNGMLWDSSQITEGLLSTACTSTLFMVSPDKAFSTVGTQSKINYKEAYHGYRKFILAALHDGSPSQKRMQRTFKWLNARVFADGPAPAENSTSRPNNDEFSVALAAMSIDDNDSDDSDHNSGDHEDGGEGSDGEGSGNNEIEGEGGGDENDAMDDIYQGIQYPEGGHSQALPDSGRPRGDRSAALEAILEEEEVEEASGGEMPNEGTQEEQHPQGNPAQVQQEQVPQPIDKRLPKARKKPAPKKPTTKSTVSSRKTEKPKSNHIAGETVQPGGAALDAIEKPPGRRGRSRGGAKD
ncbi:hypothetical protein DFP72DRAFT_1179781 [Ephemerocybe angulata]|uniref:Uncharacterized protein n=1 Tax=Ephemerocybe angulata TaxID=980116 RepID=A0A8H6H9Z2_9AGAR|nr:hypothetical protein DFP72DRAFT_1179781 [Tulosesus angulatus]